MTLKIKRQKTKNNSGFIALISAIVISVILLLLATNLSLTSFYGRFNILDSELKERSSALAEACVDVAVLKLANNGSYTGLETIGVSGSDVCTIKNINPTTDPIVIDTKAIFNQATTNLHVKVSKVGLGVVSFEEV